MLQLRTFGGLSLEDERGPLTGAATQRRKLALLVLLASAGERGVSRDKLLTYLWPESDTARARRSLAQLLYALRRDLPADLVASGSTELRLNPEVISSDVGEFDQALAQEDRERAVALYAGPFLDGFHLDGAPEFERWADGEREQRAQQVATAIEALANDASGRGDHPDAVRWWRKLAALDPLNGRVALGLMTALDAAGDRAGALQHARVHEVLLREELDTAPDAAVLALAERLRTPPASEEPGPDTVQRPGARNVTRDPSPPEPEIAPRRAPAGRLAVSPRRWRLAIPGAALVTLVLLAVVGGWAAWQRSQPPPPAMPTPMAVAVLPFEVRGSSEYAYLAEGMVDLLSANLDGAGELRAVDPRALLSFVARQGEDTADPEQGRAIAERFDARRFVLGNIVEAGGRLRISATLYDRSYGPSVIAQASVAGDAAQLFELVDGLTAELLASSYTGPRERLTRIAVITTHSMPALKAYLVGENHLRAARYVPALEAFQQAIAQDSTFALAYYRLALAAEWEDRLDVAVDAADQAVRHGNRLSEHDRLLVQALHARRRGAADEAERLYRTIVGTHPDDVEAWYQLGEVLFHYNPYRGRSFTESRGAWERVLALEPNHRDALLHLVRVAAREGKRIELDSLLTWALALSPPPKQRELQAFRAFALGTKADQDRIVEELRTAEHTVLWQSAWRIAVYTQDLTGAERVARLMVESSRPQDTQSRGRYGLMMLLVGQGRWKEAVADGAPVRRPLPWSPRVGDPHFAVLGFFPVDQVALAELRVRFARWDAAGAAASPAAESTYRDLYSPLREYFLGLLSIRLGERARGRIHVQVLDTVSTTPSTRGLARLSAAVLRADAARVEGRPAEALAFLEQVSVEVPIEFGGQFGIQPYSGWLRAELLHQLRRDGEALGWYASRVDLFLNEVIYLAPAHLRQGEIHERLGNVAKAVEHYSRFVELWKDCDPELRPILTEVQRRLARLHSQVGA